MKTIIKLLCIPLLFIGMSCSVEPLADSNEDLNSVALKGKRKGNCDVFKERPSRNTYVGGEASTFSGTWGYPVGEYTGYSFNIVLTFNDDGTATQTSDDIVIAEGEDELWTSSIAQILPSSETTGTYTSDFVVTGGTGRFDGATGSFRIKNGVYDLVTGSSSHNAIGKITSYGLCDD